MCGLGIRENEVIINLWMHGSMIRLGWALWCWQGMHSYHMSSQLWLSKSLSENNG